MRDRIYLIGYLATVVLLTSIHDLRWLLPALLIIGLFCGRDLPRILKRAALATAFFCTLISLGWLLSSLRHGDVPWLAIGRLNVRVLTLTMLGFLLTARINLDAALAWSPRLLTLSILIRSQLQTFRRQLDDYRLATRSRTCRRFGLRDGQRAGGAAVAGLLQRAETASQDITMGMSSRGFFLDQD
jgi:cobalt/nickel transport system permease protein